MDLFILSMFYTRKISLMKFKKITLFMLMLLPVCHLQSSIDDLLLKFETNLNKRLKLQENMISKRRADMQKMIKQGS